MPTPSHDTIQLSTSIAPPQHERSAHSTCPPEIERPDAWRNPNDDLTIDDGMAVDDSPRRQDDDPVDGEVEPPELQDTQEAKMDETLREQSSPSSSSGMSPMSIESEVKEVEHALPPTSTLSPRPSTTAAPSTNLLYSDARVCISLHCISTCLLPPANISTPAISRPPLFPYAPWLQIPRHATI